MNTLPPESNANLPPDGAANSTKTVPGTPAKQTVQSSRRLSRKGWLGLAGLLALVLSGLVVTWSVRWRESVPADGDLFPLTELSPSLFLNTAPEVRFVGSEACRSCHAGRTASFRRTGMGRSMAAVDPAEEPPDAAFDHAPSKRRYQVVRRDGKLWHRELLLPAGPEEVVLSEFAVKYVVGSGHHSRSYFVEVDGFLVESPITWYTSRKAWGMSPGYDSPDQAGFARAAGEGCLVCHAGQSEAVDQSLHRMLVSEAAIGCERCHGPGALHVERYQKPADGATEGIDYTIVNPAHLSRELKEAICQQCHLRASATIVGRGRKLADFRPGLPLQDFRQDYVLELSDRPMTVVGHVEQLHLSRCYQASKTLTCVTCHDPHSAPRADHSAAYFKSKCLTCHESEHCKVTAARRLQESPDNNCVHCHMPRSATEIPHLAFTHHRIGIHTAPQKETAHTPGKPGILRPFLELSRLGEVDQKRALGLGYLETANREHDLSLVAAYQERALRLLSEVRKAGLRDPAVDVALSRLCFDMGLGDVALYAESALGYPDLAGQDRCNALFLLAEAKAKKGQYAEAAVALREVTQLRRHPYDWLLLADCQKALGQSAVKPLEKAVGINPRLWQIHQHLAEHYRRQGDEKRAAWHMRCAVP